MGCARSQRAGLIFKRMPNFGDEILRKTSVCKMEGG
jgi:hypothetical protein